MYNIMYETSRQSRFDAQCWMFGAGALGRPRGRVGEGGGFRMGNSGIPVADSFRYLAKLIQYCKVKKKKKETDIYIVMKYGPWCIYQLSIATLQWRNLAGMLRQ